MGMEEDCPVDGPVKSDSGYGKLFLCWALGCILVLFFLFGYGKLLFGEYLLGGTMLALSAVAAIAVFFVLAQTSNDRK